MVVNTMSTKSFTPACGFVIYCVSRLRNDRTQCYSRAWIGERTDGAEDPIHRSQEGGVAHAVPLWREEYAAEREPWEDESPQGALEDILGS